MLRAAATFLTAWIVTTLVAALGALPGTPSWTAWVGGLGAGFLASTVVLMEERLAEDLLKGVIFGFIGGALLFLDVPGWVGWPLIVGPWVGLLGNRGRGGPAGAETAGGAGGP